MLVNNNVENWDLARKNERFKMKTAVTQRPHIEKLITVRSLNVKDFSLLSHREDQLSDRFFITFKKPVPVGDVARLIGQACYNLAVKYCTEKPKTS